MSTQSPKSPADRTRERFRARFAREPHAVATAPGRVNLLGEHVDHRGGVVLPFAIESRIAVALGPSENGRTTIVADDVSLEGTWDGPPPVTPIDDPHRAFANHVFGMLAALGPSNRAAFPPLEMVIAGDVPLGGGLSSSAALEVAVGLAATAALSRPIPDVRTLAEAAREAEHRFVGTPCGLMDPLASAAGRAGRILRIDCDRVDLDEVPEPDPTRAVMVLLDSGVRHRLSDGGYADRLAALDRVEQAIGRPLRTIEPADLDRVLAGNAGDLEPADGRRARHVVTEMARVRRALETLRDGDVAELGRLLFEAHASLRDDFEVSIAELDRLVGDAEDRLGRGVHGARMVGGGFGGSVLLLVEPSRAATIVEEISASFDRHFGRRPTTRTVRPSDGACIEATEDRPVSYPRRDVVPTRDPRRPS